VLFLDVLWLFLNYIAPRGGTCSASIVASEAAIRVLVRLLAEAYIVLLGLLADIHHVRGLVCAFAFERVVDVRVFGEAALGSVLLLGKAFIVLREQELFLNAANVF
jgi:hypothetical protein